MITHFPTIPAGPIPIEGRRALFTHSEISVVPIDWIRALVVAQDEATSMPAVLQFLPYVAIAFLFYMMLIRPERQKQATHKALLADVKKSDRIVTSGGIKGIVANVHREADEITITVDESTGTKIRVTLGSIARVEPTTSKNESKTK